MFVVELQVPVSKATAPASLINIHSWIVCCKVICNTLTLFLTRAYFVIWKITYFVEYYRDSSFISPSNH